MTKEDFDKQPCRLFSIDLTFDYETGVQRWHIHNQSWAEVRGFRETLITHGFFLERSPGRGEIIFPWQLRRCMIDVQPKGFKDDV